MKKIRFALLILFMGITSSVFAQKHTGAFRKADNPSGGQVQEQQFSAAPDVIVIDEKNYRFDSFEKIYTAFKNAPEHKADASFTLANLKKWNAGKTLEKGAKIWLVKPY
jgi:hypothetical protein